MKLDFSDVKETKLVEEGEQELTIIGAKEARSANGTAMLVLDMNDAEGGFVGLQATDLSGNTVNCKIEHEEYNEETRAKVKKYLA